LLINDVLDTSDDAKAAAETSVPSLSPEKVAARIAASNKEKIDQLFKALFPGMHKKSN
jgi:hypothetical protein